MEKFTILSDVNCDLGEKFTSEYGIEIVFGHYVTPDGVEHRSVLDWNTVSREEFYDALKKDPNGFSSAPPSVGEFYEAFEKHAKAGEPVIAICISEKLSGAIGFMTEAKKEILEKYPEAKIEIIDSQRFGPAIGLIAVHAAALRKEGKSFEAVVEYIEANKNRFHQMGWLDDLDFVAKKGRLSHAKAFFGKMVGIKPLGDFDCNGLTTVIGKAKGEKAAYNVIIEYISRTIENPEEQTIFVATTNRRKQAEVLKTLIEEKFHPKAVYVNDVFPNCGINVGPGLMAAYYMGKPISDELVEEKKLMDEIIG